MERYEKLILDEERALYGLNGAEVVQCVFEGPADGESALKECKNVHLVDCDLRLRYPLWHVDDSTLTDCRMTETCRAALWYDSRIAIRDCHLGGIKALRECRDVTIQGGDATSTEFGWMSHNMKISDFTLNSEYPFLHATNTEFERFTLHGKYSFQYTKNLTFRNCVLDTKDAFWHAENVTVYDSVVKGEYLAWYSTNLRLVRCHIIGTQPLCYCKGLILEDCTTEGCDLSFENSEVTAAINGAVMSVKNPASGSITADEIGEIIIDEFKWEGDCPITVRKQDSIA